ncbi:MAG: TIGR02996 domain-containing protein, partial [Myxococcales bacterium]|nr:TIGR02996 domain-containing protein [Myxococcales bacterium]
MTSASRRMGAGELPSEQGPGQHVDAAGGDDILRAMSVQDHLNEALEAAEARRYPEALAALLTAWRTQPDAAIAEAVDAVAARAAHGRALPPGKTAGARDEIWMEAARSADPVTMGLLVDSLLDTKGCKHTLTRLQVLAAAPSDPRLGTKVAAILREPPYNASVTRTNSFWKALFSMLPDLGDPRLLPLAGELPPLWAADDSQSELERETLTKRLAKATPALEKRYGRAMPLDDEAVALCRRIPEAMGERAPTVVAAERTEEALLAEIYDNPSEDGPRLVYADWLLERSDPRGELIMLQFKKAQGGKPSREDQKREKELLALHGDAWVDGMGVMKGGRLFEKGFLAECKASAINDHPGWNLVRAVTGTIPIHDRPLPSLRSIREIRFIDKLAKLTVPLDVVALDWHGPYFEYTKWGRWGLEAIAQWPAIARILPKLERLAIRGGEHWAVSYDRKPSVLDPTLLSWIFDGGLVPHLRILALPLAFERLAEVRAAWLDAGPRLERTYLCDRGGDHWDSAWQLALARDEDGVHLEICEAPRLLGKVARDDQEMRGWDRVVAGLRSLAGQTLTSVRFDPSWEKRIPRQHL